MPPEDQRIEAGAGDAPAVTIVRYPNRRLYDRSQGRYVTLPEVAALVRDGKTVAVRDSKTDEDLTRQVLTQIILDQHPERMDLFPVPVLHLMIRANDIALGFLRDYMRQSLVYLELWNRAASLTPWAAPLEWLRAFVPGQSPPGNAVRSATESPAPSAVGPGDAEQLARRVAELERRLAVDGRPPERPADASAEGQPQARRPGSRRPGRKSGRRREER